MRVGRGVGRREGVGVRVGSGAGVDVAATCTDKTWPVGAGGRVTTEELTTAVSPAMTKTSNNGPACITVFGLYSQGYYKTGMSISVT